MNSATLVSFLGEVLHNYPVLSLAVFLGLVMFTYYKWILGPMPHQFNEASRHSFNGRTPTVE